MVRIIGGALCFGSTLLNPGPSEEDLQKQLKVTKAKLDAKGNSDEVMRRLIQGMTIRTGATPEVLNTECSVVNLIIIFIVICLVGNYIWGTTYRL